MHNCDCQSPLTKRGHERHEKILEAAGEVFAEQGYAGASINEIVRRSGGSLGTIYKFFGNKLGLFEAYFQKATCEVFSRFHAEDFWSDDIEASLTKFAAELQNLMLEPDAVAVYRLVLNDRSSDQAEIQRIFMQNGPQQINQFLSAYLRAQAKKQPMAIVDFDLAAYQFVEMIKGPMHFQKLFGLPIDPKMCELTVKQAVAIFLRGSLKTA